MNEWNITSRSHSCETCGKTFADKEHYHTALFDHKHELKRSDICLDCWQKGDPEGISQRKGFISIWQGIYEAPTPVAEVIQKDTAETLLRKLIELNEPRYIPAGYILAVMLERKRLLRIKEQFKRDGKRVFIYEQPKTGDIFTIVDPDLQLDQLAEVQRDVSNLLENGLGAVTGTAVESATKPVDVAAEPVVIAESPAEASANLEA
jgi:hypothetical protein